MADLKISQLTNAFTLAGGEYIPLVQSGINKKATPEQIKTYIGTISIGTATGLSITSNQINYAAGYSIPTTTNQSNWDAAYNWGDHSTEGYYVGTSTTIRSLFSSTAMGITYTSGTGVFSLTSGYSIPTTTNQTNWTTAYNKRISSMAFSGTTTKTLTITLGDNSTVAANFTDLVGEAGSGATQLDELSDVTITSIATGNILRYNGSLWVNLDPSSVGYFLTSSLVRTDATTNPASVRYTGTTRTSGYLYGASTTAPSSTTYYLNYDGHFRATRLYEGSTRVLTTDKGVSSMAFTGTNPKTLTLTLRDSSTVSAQFNDLQGSGAGPIQITGKTILSTGWVSATPNYYDLSDSNITVNSIVEVIPENAYISIVTAAEILPAVLSSAGSVRIYATNIPTGNIGVTLNIVEKST